MILASEPGKVNIPPSPEYPRAPLLFERLNTSTSESAAVTIPESAAVTRNSTLELIDTLRADLIKLKGESAVHIPSENIQGILEDLDKNIEILADLCSN